jgi:hypothetical protein
MSREDDELDAWINDLSGRTPKDKRDPSNEMLRNVIKEHGQRADEQALASVTLRDTDEQALRKLQERLRREKLLFVNPVEVKPKGWLQAAVEAVLGRPQAWIPAAGIAVVAVAIGFNALRPGQPGARIDYVMGEAPIFRDGGAVNTRASDPESAARALASALSKSQVPSTVYITADRSAVFFELQPEQFDAAKGALASVALKPEVRTGLNRVIYSKE